ncbi:MAG: hypothetical protein QF460_03610 [Candidatus Nanoarchaeia archaeon]|nr:hypothetical protein [Candidatus Nanoarchaeia archaeon]
MVLYQKSTWNVGSGVYGGSPRWKMDERVEAFKLSVLKPGI